jgi:pimeloyl-ACP methyl ester carboxylesterase
VPTIQSNGLWIHYEAEGDPAQPTVLLVHGFASNGADNWVATGWVKALRAAGRRVVYLDCRGHGASDKPRDPAAYSLDAMAGDVEELLRYANARTVDLFGYSMGARISLHLLTRGKSARVRSAILGGVGENTLRARRDAAAIADALAAPDASKVENPVARAFRDFAEGRGNDLLALAAVSRAQPHALEREKLAAVRTPTLVVAGSKDVLVGSPQGLAAALGNARAEVVPDADHLTAVAHPRFKEVVLSFLAGVDAAAAKA